MTMTKERIAESLDLAAAYGLAIDKSLHGEHGDLAAARDAWHGFIIANGSELCRLAAFALDVMATGESLEGKAQKLPDGKYKRRK